MKKVMVFGTFDNLHKGHRFFLERASSQGNYLIAVVARDTTVDELKGVDPLHNYHNRKKHLLETGLVNKALPSDKKRGSWTVINQEKPQVICLGHDQTRMEESLRDWLNHQENYNPEVVILPPFKRKIYSTTAHRRRRDSLFILLLILSMVLMSLSWISGKLLSTQASFKVMVFWRFFFSLLPFLPIGVHFSWFKISSKEFALTLFSALFLVLYNFSFFLGLSRGLAGKGGVIVTTLNPLLTTLIFLSLLKKRPSQIALIGISLGIVGGIILIEPWHLTGQELFAQGNIFFLGAALCWSCLTILSGKAQKTMSLRKYSFYLYLMASLGSLLVALPDSPFDMTKLSPSFWVNIIYLGIFVSAIATTLFFMATKKLGPPRTSSFLLLIPLLALLFSWLILKEVPQTSTILGGLFSMGALYFLNKKELL